MADTGTSLRARDGLPSRTSGDHVFGTGPNGELYALSWQPEADAFQAVGFGADGRPTAFLVREGDPRVVRSLEVPIACLPFAGQGAPAVEKTEPAPSDDAIASKSRPGR